MPSAEDASPPDNAVRRTVGLVGRQRCRATDRETNHRAARPCPKATDGPCRNDAASGGAGGIGGVAVAGRPASPGHPCDRAIGVSFWHLLNASNISSRENADRQIKAIIQARTQSARLGAGGQLI